MDGSQVIILYTLNLHSAVCQLNLKKTERERKQFITLAVGSHWNMFSGEAQWLEKLRQKAMTIKEETEKQADYATSALMDNYLCNYSKKLWMLNETIK